MLFQSLNNALKFGVEFKFIRFVKSDRKLFRTLGNEIYHDQKSWNGNNWYWHTVLHHWIIKIIFLSIVVDDLRPLSNSLPNPQFEKFYLWNNRIIHDSMHLIWFNEIDSLLIQLISVANSWTYSIRFLLGKSIILFFAHFFFDGEPDTNFFFQQAKHEISNKEFHFEVFFHFCSLSRIKSEWKSGARILNCSPSAVIIKVMNCIKQWFYLTFNNHLLCLTLNVLHEGVLNFIHFSIEEFSFFLCRNSFTVDFRVY